MRVSAFVVAAVLLISAPALAQTDPSPAAAPPPAASEPAAPEVDQGRPDPDEEVICRWVENSVETRLRRGRTRLCATRTQWEFMADEARRSVIGLGSTQGPSRD